MFKTRKHWLPLALLLALTPLAACEDDPVSTDDHDHEAEVEGVVVLAGGDVEVLRYTDDDGVDADTLRLERGVTTPVVIRFIDHDGEPITFHDEEELSLAVQFADATIATWTADDTDPWSGSIEALVTGETTVRISLMHGSHADWSSVIPVEVSE